MYEVMVFWETVDVADGPPYVRDFAEIWRAADKIVYSRTLESTQTARTRLERELDPNAIRALKRSAASDISVGGAEFAGQALAAGLVDECHLFLHPIIVGAGKRALPAGVNVRLELLDQRRFGSGVVYLRYRTGPRAE